VVVGVGVWVVGVGGGHYFVCSLLQCITMCCGVLQYECSVCQCVAVCCNVSFRACVVA